MYLIVSCSIVYILNTALYSILYPRSYTAIIYRSVCRYQSVYYQMSLLYRSTIRSIIQVLSTQIYILQIDTLIQSYTLHHTVSIHQVCRLSVYQYRVIILWYSTATYTVILLLGVSVICIIPLYSYPTVYLKHNRVPIDHSLYLCILIYPCNL